MSTGVLGSEERQPLASEDIPLPFGLLAVEPEWAQRGLRGFRTSITALEQWASHAGEIGKDTFPPGSAVQAHGSE
jgi:hypothetical protein